MNTVAVIPAAGLSSRMKAFKPLLELNGIPMIRLTVQTLLDGGTEKLCIILGREGERIQDALDSRSSRLPVAGALLQEDLLSEGARIEYVWNHGFASSDMLQSVKLGLGTLLENETEKIDAAFVVPGDMPAIAPVTCGLLRNLAATRQDSVFLPRYLGRNGHPLLFKRECFDAVLGFEGQGGLKNALRGFRTIHADVEDAGISADADDPKSFERLSALVRKTKGMSEEAAKSFSDACETPRHIREHCLAVGRLTARMVGKLNKTGFCLDSQLAVSAAILHDMNRLSKNHAQVAGDKIGSQGFDAVARIVRQHHTMPDKRTDFFTEASLVFLADKLVKETEPVGPEKRYETALRKFSSTTEVGRRIRDELDFCRRFAARYEEVTGDCLSLGEK